jgi:ankyrin repeat protein
MNYIRVLLIACTVSTIAQSEDATVAMLQKADYEGLKRHYELGKDNAPKWRALAAKTAAAQWTNALSILNKSLTPTSTLNEYLPDHSMRKAIICEITSAKGLLLKLDKGAQALVEFRKVQPKDRLALMHKAFENPSLEQTRGLIALAALHDLKAECSVLLKKSTAPDGELESGVAQWISPATAKLEIGVTQNGKDLTENRPGTGTPMLRPARNPLMTEVTAVRTPRTETVTGVKKTVQMIDFNNCDGLFSNIYGNIVPTPDGTGKCLELVLSYDEDSVRGGTAILDFAKATLRLSPYLQCHIEAYYEGAKDPSMEIFFERNTENNSVFCFAQAAPLRAGQWFTKKLYVSPDNVHTFPFAINDIARAGHTFDRIGFFADANLTRGIKKLLIRRIHFFEQNDLADIDDINARDAHGNSRLHLAAMDGDVAEVERLIAAGWGIEDVTRAGGTPLLVATYCGQVEVVKTLLKHKANIEALTPVNTTALITAARHNEPELVSVLLDHGANLNYVPPGGIDALEAAVHLNSPECVAILLDRAKPTQEDLQRYLLVACMRGDVEKRIVSHYREATANVLVERGAKMDFVSHVMLNHSDDVAAAIKADATLTKQVFHGMTALHFAAATGALETAKLLIDAGADVNARATADWSAQTPMHMACTGRESYIAIQQKNIIDALLARKADAALVDSVGDTPFMLATKHSHFYATYILQRRNAAIDTGNGSTNVPPKPPVDGEF